MISTENKVSTTTKALRIDPVTKSISTENLEIYDTSLGLYVGTTLKIKNLTEKTCNLTPSFFEKLFGKHEKIKITKNTLVPSEETLVYIVFRNIPLFEFHALNYRLATGRDYRLATGRVLKPTTDAKEYNGINILLNHYDYILHETSEFNKNWIGTESERCKDRNSDSCRFYEDNVSELEYFTELKNKINAEIPLIIEQHFCK